MSDKQEPTAWWVYCDDYESVTLLREHADALAAPHGITPIPLYDRPQPALTDAERLVVSTLLAILSEGQYSEFLRDDADILRGLLERTK